MLPDRLGRQQAGLLLVDGIPSWESGVASVASGVPSASAASRATVSVSITRVSSTGCPGGVGELTSALSKAIRSSSSTSLKMDSPLWVPRLAGWAPARLAGRGRSRPHLAPHHDDVAALCSAPSPVRADLVVADHVLGAAAVADRSAWTGWLSAYKGAPRGSRNRVRPSAPGPRRWYRPLDGGPTDHLTPQTSSAHGSSPSPAPGTRRQFHPGPASSPLLRLQR